MNPSTALIPIWKQTIQSIQIGGPMSVLQEGDGFYVDLISEDEDPESYGVPYYKVNPDSSQELANTIILREK